MQGSLCERGCDKGGELGIIEHVSMIIMNISVHFINRTKSLRSITSSPCSRRTSMANPYAGCRDSWTVYY